jgi:hypothetical protein
VTREWVYTKDDTGRHTRWCAHVWTFGVLVFALRCKGGCHKCWKVNAASMETPWQTKPFSPRHIPS